MRQFAFFDLDDTLLQGNSDQLWGQYLIDHNHIALDYMEQRSLEFRDQYRAGRLDMAAFVRFSTEFLQSQPSESLRHHQQQFANRYLQPRLKNQTEQLLGKEREAGATVVLVTATNDFLAEAAAKLLAPDIWMATELERCPQGTITGGIRHQPCFREGKLWHIHRHLQPNSTEWQAASAYSDSINDLPMLAAAGRPHAVDPCPALRSHAQQNNWPILELL